MINMVINDTEINMKKHLNFFHKYVKSTRTNRASPNLLENIKIEYNNSLIPLKKIASISTKNTNTLILNIFDSSLTPIIKKNIMLSKLNLNPSITDNNTILITLPPLTKERRLDIIKVIREQAENARISIRNIRRENNNKLKKLLKEKKINKDENNKTQEKIQILTKKYIKDVDLLLLNKENEIIKI